MYATRIGHICQKWSYNSSCFTYYVLFDINMLKMLKIYHLSNQNNDSLDKIKTYVAFVTGCVFK